MVVGSIGYSTVQGLGLLLKDFYDNGLVHVVYNYLHSSRPNNPDWYGNEFVCPLNTYDERHLLKFLKTIDLLLLLETPFRWEILNLAKSIGVKTVLMPMHECTPEVLPVLPDGIINPSKLDQENYPQGKYIPVPVSNHVEWNQRYCAKQFVHNAGHLGLRGRNGTRQLIEAMEYVEVPCELLIRSQTSISYPKQLPKNVTIEIGEVPFKELWNFGDVFIFPERFNGLSLPLQEARAAGMYVMCQDRFPMNDWLPIEGLIPVGYEHVDRIGNNCPYVDSIPSPQFIAAKINSVYGKDIEDYSYQGKLWGQRNSWEALKPTYQEYFSNVLKGANHV